jgi:hypothetical protein
VGGFVDTAVNRFLGQGPRAEGAIYCVGLGHSSEARAHVAGISAS